MRKKIRKERSLVISNLPLITEEEYTHENEAHCVDGTESPDRISSDPLYCGISCSELLIDGKSNSIPLSVPIDNNNPRKKLPMNTYEEENHPFSKRAIRIDPFDITADYPQHELVNSKGGLELKTSQNMGDIMKDLIKKTAFQIFTGNFN